jgi:hypothetical protein
VREYTIYIVNVQTLELIQMKEQPVHVQYPAWRPLR